LKSATADDRKENFCGQTVERKRKDKGRERGQTAVVATDTDTHRDRGEGRGRGKEEENNGKELFTDLSDLSILFQRHTHTISFPHTHTDRDTVSFGANGPEYLLFFVSLSLLFFYTHTHILFYLIFL
jgi:hypothetical protein